MRLNSVCKWKKDSIVSACLLQCCTINEVKSSTRSCSFKKKQVLLPCYINARRINEQYLQVHTKKDYYSAARALYVFLRTRWPRRCCCNEDDDDDDEDDDDEDDDEDDDNDDDNDDEDDFV